MLRRFRFAKDSVLCWRVSLGGVNIDLAMVCILLGMDMG